VTATIRTKFVLRSGLSTPACRNLIPYELLTRISRRFSAMKAHRIVRIVACAVLLALFPSPCPAIAGGSPDGNGHPNVGVLGFDLDGPGGALPPFAVCAAFVASDSVMITAAHCIQVAPHARWAVSLQPGSPSSPVVHPGVYPDDFPFPILAAVTYAEQVFVHPAFGQGQTRANDVAVLVFPEGTFAEVTPVLLPSERQLEVLAVQGALRGQNFTLVGYGAVPIDRTTEQALVQGFRQVASAPFQGLMPESLILQANPEPSGAGSTCHGDSGGPQFLASSNLAVSLVGGITNQGAPCGTGAQFFQRLDTPVIREFLAQHVAVP